MLVDFNTLPDDSRIWIYQANRTLTEDEVSEIETKLTKFIQEWTAHGANLNAGFEIKYKRFIVIALDQERNAATGCSIDASVHFIMQLEKDYDIDLMDKMNVSFKQGEYITYKSLIDFKKTSKK
jgi:hypothetical protein